MTGLSALHKMYFKVYKNFDQINAGLMTISDLLLFTFDLYIYIYIYIYIFFFFFFFTLPLFFYIWAPAPEELSARPCSGATDTRYFTY